MLVQLLFLLQICIVTALTVYPSPGPASLASPFYSVESIGPFFPSSTFVYFTARALMQPVAPGNNVPAPSNKNTSFFGFGMVQSDSPVKVVITCLTRTPSSAQFYPLRAAALVPQPVINGQSVTIEIDQPRQICIIINGVVDAPLCIFADPDETYRPSQSDPSVIYFGPGTTDAGVINVAPGETVYLAGGAHVFGRIAFSGSSALCSVGGRSVAVRGRGVLDGLKYIIDVNGPSLVTLPCTGALLEGVTLINSPQYHLSAPYPYMTVNWAKAISWGYSTDGFEGGAQSLIQNAFIKVNDDSLKIFATGMLVQNIVLWQMENGCAAMGSWNLNSNVEYVTVRGLDIIRHERVYDYYDPNALLCFLHGGSGQLSNYLFEDIRVDMPGWAAVQFYVQPNRFASPVNGILGSLSSLIVRNFSSSGPFLAPFPIQIAGYAPMSRVTQVTMDTVSINGMPLSSGQVAINTSFATPVTICTGCSASTVGADWTEAQKCGTPTSNCQESASPPLEAPFALLFLASLASGALYI